LAITVTELSGAMRTNAFGSNSAEAAALAPDERIPMTKPAPIAAEPARKTRRLCAKPSISGLHRCCVECGECPRCIHHGVV
jgi:hypothetical protein